MSSIKNILEKPENFINEFVNYQGDLDKNILILDQKVNERSLDYFSLRYHNFIVTKKWDTMAQLNGNT